MELLIKENISVLPQKYCLTETFPELAKCPEDKFINFQDKLSRILSRLN